MGRGHRRALEEAVAELAVAADRLLEDAVPVGVEVLVDAEVAPGATMSSAEPEFEYGARVRSKRTAPTAITSGSAAG